MWQVYREVQIRYACFSCFWSSKKKWILHFMRYTSTTDTAGRHPTGMNGLSVISVKNMACRCRFFRWIWNQRQKRGNNLWRKRGGRSAGNCLKRKCRAGTPAKSRWRTMKMTMPRHFCGICAADADCMDWAGSVRSTASISVRFSE